MSETLLRIQLAELNTLRVRLPDGMVVELPFTDVKVAKFTEDSRFSAATKAALFNIAAGIRTILEHKEELEIEFSIPVPK